MTSLKQLQESFQRGILAGDDTILAEIEDSAKEERKVLFGVYRYAYVARLAEVLADDYAELHSYLGDAAFRQARQGLCRSASLRSAERPRFRPSPSRLSAREYEAMRSIVELAEIARLEKALMDAFDGPDAKPLRLAELGEIRIALWPRLVFQPHPTARQPQFRDQCRGDLVCAA